MHMPPNQAGDRFTRLVLLRPGSPIGGKSYWVCLCDCGTECTTAQARLRKGATRSCGCLVGKYTRAPRARAVATPTRASWANMRARCLVAYNAQWHNYGGRGITICPEWDDFVVFLADMGQRPAGCSLDRIDSNKGYSKENCRWATDKQQARNKRSNHLITLDGVTQCLAAWAETTGLLSATIDRRLRAGDSPEQALRPVARRMDQTPG